MRLPFLILLLMTATAAQPKPLITNSEQTLVSVCTGYDDTDERLLQICAAALEEPGLTNRKRAEILTAHADALGWLDRNAEARVKYTAALEADPFYADAHEGLGWTNWMEDDYSAAIENFQLALDLSPSSDALAGLAASRFEAGVIDAQEAVTLFEAALAIEPDNRWVLRRIGWTELGEENFEAALTAFEQALDLYGEDAAALEGAALSHYHLDDDETALSFINAALAAAPETPGYIQRRSMILLSLDRPAAALRDAETYLEMRPDDAIGFVRKGRALVDLGRTMAGLTVMAVARARLPRDNDLDYWYARTLANDGKAREAWGVMSYHLDEGAGDFWDYVLIAFLSVETDRFEAAIDAVGHMQTLRPGNRFTHYWDAVTQLYLDDLDTAEARIRRAVDAGLSDSMLGDFMEHMVGQGHYIRAAALRIGLRQELLAKDASEPKSAAPE
ncbi:MAG: tetratricopeptide repeat protein [Pseudomonadota bacterium]